MKTRFGFVSNSSTTTFVILATKENHEATLARLSEENRAAVELLDFSDAHKFGMDCVNLNYARGERGYSPFDWPNAETKAFLAKYGKVARDIFHEGVDTYMDEIQKDKDNCFFSSESDS